MKIYNFFKNSLKSLLSLSFLKFFSRGLNEDEVYRSASTLPIQNWWDIHEGKIESIFKSPRKPKPIEIKELDKVWATIVSEFIDEIGISKSYSKIMRIEDKLELFRYKYAATQDTQLKLDITILEEQLAELIGSEKESISKNKEMAYLNKEGFTIDEHKMSVLKYYACIKVMEEKIAANRQTNGK